MQQAHLQWGGNSRFWCQAEQAVAPPDAVYLFNNFMWIQPDVGQQFNRGGNGVDRAIISCLQRLKFGKVLFGSASKLVFFIWLILPSHRLFFEFDANIDSY